MWNIFLLCNAPSTLSAPLHLPPLSPSPSLPSIPPPHLPPILLSLPSLPYHPSPPLPPSLSPLSLLTLPPSFPPSPTLPPPHLPPLLHAVPHPPSANDRPGQYHSVPGAFASANGGLSVPAHSYSRAVSSDNMVHTTNPPPEQWPTTARVHGPVIAIVTETLARLSTHRGGVSIVGSMPTPVSGR